jgi:hypothetical protein
LSLKYKEFKEGEISRIFEMKLEQFKVEEADTSLYLKIWKTVMLGYFEKKNIRRYLLAHLDESNSSNLKYKGRFWGHTNSDNDNGYF